MTYIFLDTNVFLHYKDFEQIPWNEIVGDDDFSIVIPDKIVFEIDKVKDGPAGKIKERARKISKKFADYFLHDKHNARFKVVSAEDPDSEFLRQKRLDCAKSDHVIIGSILLFNQLENSIAISRDNAFLMTARRHGIRFMEMPEEFMRADEKSDAEKERDEYKRKLDEIQNRRSELEVTFMDGSSVLEIVAPDPCDIKALISSKIDEIKASHPYLYRRSRPEITRRDGEVIREPIPLESLDRYRSLNDVIKRSIQNFSPPVDPLFMVSDAQIADYNRKLDDYFSKCRQYYFHTCYAELLREQMRELTFKIVNKGTAMSGEMLVCIQLPDDVAVYNKKCHKKIEVVEPHEPEFPTIYGAIGFSDFCMVRPRSIVAWNVEAPLQKNKFHVKRRNLIHGTEAPLDFDDGIFINVKEPREFVIKWQIADSESIRPFHGELTVRIVER